MRYIHILATLPKKDAGRGGGGLHLRGFFGRGDEGVYGSGENYLVRSSEGGVMRIFFSVFSARRTAGRVG